MPCKSCPRGCDIPDCLDGTRMSAWSSMCTAVPVHSLLARPCSVLPVFTTTFSLPAPLLRDRVASGQARVDYAARRRTFSQSGYMDLIRNFRRLCWLLMYLFGASPACARPFLQGRDHKKLLPLGEKKPVPGPTPPACAWRPGLQQQRPVRLNVCNNSPRQSTRQRRRRISLAYGRARPSWYA